MWAVLETRQMSGMPESEASVYFDLDEAREIAAHLEAEARAVGRFDSFEVYELVEVTE